MSSRIRWLVVAVACAGLGLSAAALFVHYWLLTDPSYVSPCDISATNGGCFPPALPSRSSSPLQNSPK